MKCKSGKHEWTDEDDADKCCNGWVRLLEVGIKFDKVYYRYYWKKVL